MQLVLNLNERQAVPITEMHLQQEVPATTDDM